MSLTITTELTIKPAAGQTQKQAEDEFLTLFTQYLTQSDSAFLTDYGPDPWGGYEGPTVTEVVVRGPEKPEEKPQKGSAKR